MFNASQHFDHVRFLPSHPHRCSFSAFVNLPCPGPPHKPLRDRLSSVLHRKRLLALYSLLQQIDHEIAVLPSENAVMNSNPLHHSIDKHSSENDLVYEALAISSECNYCCL